MCYRDNAVETRCRDSLPGMILAACSMKTLAGIRAGYSHGFIGRAADVVLNEASQVQHLATKLVR